MQSRLLIACWRAVALIGLIVIVGCSSFTAGQGGSPADAQGEVTLSGQGATMVPRPDHVIMVIEENHANSEIIGSSSAPYINSLAFQGAVLTNSHAVTHPSEPNYLALFAG